MSSKVNDLKYFNTLHNSPTTTRNKRELTQKENTYLMLKIVEYLQRHNDATSSSEYQLNK